MELSQLRALRELGDRGSIAAVAAAMHVTPSSVSQQLSLLQRGVDVPLTERIGRRTTLTDAGRALAAAVVDVEVALEKANDAVAGFRDEVTGAVSVAAFTSAGLALFGPLLRSPGRATVSVSVSDHDVRQDAFAGLVLEHDLVVAHRLLGSAPWPPSVAVVPLLEEPLDLAVRTGHPLARFDTLGPAELGAAQWVAVHDGFPLEGAIGTLSAVAEIETDVRHRVNDFEVAASVVAATDCVTLLPRYLAASGAAAASRASAASGAAAASAASVAWAAPGSVPKPGRPAGGQAVVLRPTSGFTVRRHIDVLARPETLQRRTVQAVLGEVRAVFAALVG